jgi:hypothetical protein
MTLRRPAGMTLVEMLVATAATLLLMAAIVQVFGAFGSAITNSRAILETDARMRAVAWRLRTDLAGTTVRPVPTASNGAGDGYFEVIEGPRTDITDAVSGSFVTSGTATAGPTDCDDVLLFTTRSADPLFIGRAPLAPGTGPILASSLIDTFESSVAEVAWFARITPGASNPPTYTLYRRQLLVMGYVGTDPFWTNYGSTSFNSISLAAAPFATATKMFDTFFNLPCDVSVRREANGSEDRLFPNALGDLARREARFMHNISGTVSAGNFPYRFVGHQSDSLTYSGTLAASLDGLIFDSTSQRYGEDVVLTNVIAFDVRLFDPAAAVAVPGSTPLVPGDPGFTGIAVASGAYVDLGHGTANALLAPSVFPHFSGNGDPRSKLDSANDGGRRTFDTWTTHYEANGKDDDVDTTTDEGTDGLDNDSDGKIDEPPYDANGNGVYTDPGDDFGEFETLPPYPYPLRGIEVRIRCYEPSSRQVRQVTIRHTFVPH